MDVKNHRLTVKVDAAGTRSGAREVINYNTTQKKEMDDFPRFSQLTLITANVIALTKSAELTFLGATLLVLEATLTSSFRDIVIVSDDGLDQVTGPEILRLASRGLLILGPIFLVVGITGLCGAYRKSSGWLILYLALLVVLVTVIIALCAISIPKPLVDPADEWRPLADLMLAVIVISLAIQGVMIFFTIVLLTGISKENPGQVHPHNNDPKKPRTDRGPNPVRRRSRYDY